MCKALFIVRYMSIAIKWKVRMCGESLAVTIPSQIAELQNIKEGDYMEFELIRTEEFKIKKA
jgi:antitoxin component of MazEF toxin-antitoxin module